MIINEGEIAQYGKPEEIIKQPENGFVKKFILISLRLRRTISTPCLRDSFRKQVQVG